MPKISNSRRDKIGLALSGGGVRGIAHIGVWKALSESGVEPSFISGTSAGSIVGACIAAGMSWKQLKVIAHDTFWPSLLHGETLERFCNCHLPKSFDDLKLPFAVVTSMPSKKTTVIQEGDLASAINASCSLPIIRNPVERDGLRLKDGGLTCVIPSQACRDLGAEFVIASDVWALSAFLRRFGLGHTNSRSEHVYPKHYFRSIEQTDLLIEPKIPVHSHVPSHASIDRLIVEGETAARKAVSKIELHMIA